MFVQNECKDLSVFADESFSTLLNEEGVCINEEYCPEEVQVDGGEGEKDFGGLPPMHPLEYNQNALEIDISNRVQLSSGADKAMVLVGHDGLTSAPSELAHLDHAILDGGSVGGSRAQSRRITLEFVARDRGYQAISSLFPLGQKEVIKVTRGNTTRAIEGYRDGPVQVSAASALATPVVSVSFLCPQPYFRNDVVFEGSFDRAEGGLKYPVTYPLAYGTIAGDGSAQVVNRGDYPTPFVLEMTAGSSGNLSIAIEGEELAWVTGVLANQKVVLDTRTKILSINGQKRLSAFEGTFPTIPVGESRVTLSGLSGAAVIRYSEIFEGV